MGINAIPPSANQGSTVSGNRSVANRVGIRAPGGSTLIGNTVLSNRETGISVDCPSNLTDNTATGNGRNLVLNPPSGTGCHVEDIPPAGFPRSP